MPTCLAPAAFLLAATVLRAGEAEAPAETALPHPGLPLIQGRDSLPEPDRAYELRARDLPIEILMFQRELGDPLLVAAAGPEAEKAAARALLLQPDLPLRIVRIPYGGYVEQEMGMALRRTDCRCGLRVSAAGRRRWQVSVHGDCLGPDSLPSGLAEHELQREGSEAGADTAEASGEPLDAQLLEAPRAELPPGVLLATERVRQEPAAQVYAQLSLHLRELEDDERQRPAVPWVVEDGTGARCSSERLAGLLGDEATRERLTREGRRLRQRQLIQGVLGGGLLLSALPLWIASRQGLPARRDYEDGEAYQAALDELPRGVLAEAESELWTGALLFSSGALLLGTLPLARRGVEARRDLPALLYERDLLALRIEEYNRQLNQELGIGEEPVPPEPAGENEPSQAEGSSQLRLRLAPTAISLELRL